MLLAELCSDEMEKESCPFYLSLGFPPLLKPIAEGPWQCQEIMEQPVTPIGSHFVFAPKQAKQEEQQSYSTLSWQVGEHAHRGWENKAHMKIWTETSPAVSVEENSQKILKIKPMRLIVF